MENIRAIELLNNNIEFARKLPKWQKNNEEIEMMETAEIALEKQIPKKLTDKNETDYCIDWVCPNCEKFHRNETRLNYCSECGQKIDWN